jgi:hypothetical protein
MDRTVSDAPNLRKVMSLKYNDDFLMHGVVLHFSCFRTPRVAGAMFHVKPFSPAPLNAQRRDVSRETFLRKTRRFFSARH